MKDRTLELAMTVPSPFAAHTTLLSHWTLNSLFVDRTSSSNLKKRTEYNCYELKSVFLRATKKFKYRLAFLRIAPFYVKW
jgi:hypothetical protein